MDYSVLENKDTQLNKNFAKQSWMNRSHCLMSSSILNPL